MAESKNIYEALRAVQDELKAPKNQRNSFGGYDYRSAEDILEAVKPVLAKHGLLLVLGDLLQQVGDRYYVRASARVVSIGGTPDQSIEVYGYAREEESKKGMDGSQITGAASSYARKYALNGLFLIDDTKDADTDEHRAQTTSKASANVTAAKKQFPEAEAAYASSQQSKGLKVTAKQLSFIHGLLKDLGRESDEAKHAIATKVLGHDIESLADLTATEARTLIDKLKVTLEQQ